MFDKSMMPMGEEEDLDVMADDQSLEDLLKMISARIGNSAVTISIQKGAGEEPCDEIGGLEALGDPTEDDEMKGIKDPLLKKVLMAKKMG